MTSLDTVECTGEDGSKRRRGKERREEVEAVWSVSGRSVTFLRPMATQSPTLSGRRGVSAAGNRGLDMILSSSRLQSCGFVSHTACSWQHWPLADSASSWCFFFCAVLAKMDMHSCIHFVNPSMISKSTLDISFLSH